MSIYLASTSPQRKLLLAQLGIDFQLISIAIDETPLDAELPDIYVKRMALEKCQAGLQTITQGLVIGADTCVIIGQKILGKPRDKTQAKAMLGQLSGEIHQVMSAVAIGNKLQQQCVLNMNTVEFAELSEQDIDDYIESGEYQGKAGAYGIQGKAAMFIKQMSGSYTGIVGLPLYETNQLLKQFAKIVQ